MEYCYATGAVTATVMGSIFVGAIAGNGGGGIIQHCVALNSSVTSNSPSIGRVIGLGGGYLINNYARDSGMTLVSGNTPTPYSPTSDLNGKDGFSITAIFTHGSSALAWWSGTADYSSASWSFENDRLPHLLGFDGDTQTPEVQ